MAVIIRTVNLPKLLTPNGAYGAILKEANQYAKAMKLDFDATVGTWDRKPVFQTDVSVLPDIVSVKVWTDDEIYGYVDKGTKSRDIYPKAGKRLAFRVGGTPKTRPGQDTAGPGSPGTKLIVLPVGVPVHKHAIKARNFTKEIRLHHSRDFYSRMRTAIRKWARESGHAI
jgi:hypothetical protein